ncbi:MAG: hypothetical protein ABR536_04760 [Solirubrobacterales bacterium]
MGSQPLEPLGPEFITTREALHRVAEQLIAPARKPDNEIALKATPGGFGTPVFEFRGNQCQVRVQGAELVARRGEGEKRAPITTLAAGAELIGHDLFTGGPPADTELLRVDAHSAEQLGGWFGLGGAVLGELRAGWGADDPSQVNLWPEHFDIAIEAGSEGAGARANYGFSPGDAEHHEPYVYVGPWNEVSGELWNAKGFNGAELSYSELAPSPDPRMVALEFCRARKDTLI